MFIKIIYMLVLLCFVITSCGFPEESVQEADFLPTSTTYPAMEIDFDYPALWGKPGIDEDTENMYADYQWLFGGKETSYVEVIASRNRKFFSSAEAEVDSMYENFVLASQNFDRVNENSVKLYEREICNQKAIVYERIQYAGTLVRIPDESYAIDVVYSVNEVYYTFSAAIDRSINAELEEARIAEFWGMIDSIECPSED